MSCVDLQHITDVDMYHFVGNSIREGISMISTRHAQVNKPPFPDTYDASLPWPSRNTALDIATAGYLTVGLMFFRKITQSIKTAVFLYYWDTTCICTILYFILYVKNERLKKLYYLK